MMTDQQLKARYGDPGDMSRIVTVSLPFPMRIAWDKSVVVNKISCHRDIKDRLLKALREILAHYRMDEIKRLGIDLFGGCVNVRTQRGSKTKWSRHAWGVAIDLHPDGNQLKWGRDKAMFAKPEYKKMIEIFYANGFIGYGPEKNYDWMHFEIAS